MADKKPNKSDAMVTPSVAAANSGHKRPKPLQRISTSAAYLLHLDGLAPMLAKLTHVDASQVTQSSLLPLAQLALSLNPNQIPPELRLSQYNDRLHVERPEAALFLLDHMVHERGPVQAHIEESRFNAEQRELQPKDAQSRWQLDKHAASGLTLQMQGTQQTLSFQIEDANVKIYRQAAMPEPNQKGRSTAISAAQALHRKYQDPEQHPGEYQLDVQATQQFMRQLPDCLNLIAATQANREAISLHEQMPVAHTPLRQIANLARLGEDFTREAQNKIAETMVLAPGFERLVDRYEPRAEQAYGPYRYPLALQAAIKGKKPVEVANQLFAALPYFQNSGPSQQARSVHDKIISLLLKAPFLPKTDGYGRSDQANHSDDLLISLAQEPFTDDRIRALSSRDIARLEPVAALLDPGFRLSEESQDPIALPPAWPVIHSLRQGDGSLGQLSDPAQNGLTILAEIVFASHATQKDQIAPPAQVKSRQMAAMSFSHILAQAGSDFHAVNEYGEKLAARLQQPADVAIFLQKWRTAEHHNQARQGNPKDAMHKSAYDLLKDLAPHPLQAEFASMSYETYLQRCQEKLQNTATAMTLPVMSRSPIASLINQSSRTSRTGIER